MSGRANVNLEDDEEVTDEALKKQMEESAEEELGGTPEESPTEEKPLPVTSPEDVKPVAGEEKKVSDSVPYSRFKEIQEEKARLQAELDQMRNKPEVKSSEADPDDLTEEEQLMFDPAQIRIMEKIAAKREKMAVQRIRQEQEYVEKANTNFNKAVTKFPDLKNKDSEIWKRADKIVREKYTQWSSDKKSYYIPPESQWLAALEADVEIREEKERTEKATKEEKSNKKQNTFVETKSRKAPVSRETSDDDIDNMSSSELDKAMREDFDKRKESLEL